MDELPIGYLTGALIAGYFLAHVVTKRFDPFAPTWLFLVGYTQVYVIQAIRYHQWGVGIRGRELVAAADWRALWALLWFFAVYHLGPGRPIVSALPRPPRAWSSTAVAALAPPLVVWGLVCAGIMRNASQSESAGSAEVSVFANFPFVMLVAAILLIVTGRTIRCPRPAFAIAGLAVSGAYVLIWMFNGKRSHALIGVLTTICAMYLTRLKRPSWSVLFSTAFAGALVVTVAIGWRNDRSHERSLSGFAGFLADFQVSRMAENLNLVDGEEEKPSYESEEYGGFLLMMDTVPAKSGYDHGENYLRAITTFIPRVLWPGKPVYGRTAWINAWIAGSELERDDDFTGPSIGLLGATQLNGGAAATAIVVGCIALLLRTAYEYLRRYPDVAWVQFFWTIFYFNAWFMVVSDDPLVWFYYNWGFTTLPWVVVLWWVNRFGRTAASPDDAGTAAAPAEAPSSGPFAGWEAGSA